MHFQKKSLYGQFEHDMPRDAGECFQKVLEPKSLDTIINLYDFFSDSIEEKRLKYEIQTFTLNPKMDNDLQEYFT